MVAAIRPSPRIGPAKAAHAPVASAAPIFLTRSIAGVTLPETSNSSVSTIEHVAAPRGTIQLGAAPMTGQALTSSSVSTSTATAEHAKKEHTWFGVLDSDIEHAISLFILLTGVICAWGTVWLVRIALRDSAARAAAAGGATPAAPKAD